MFCDPFLHGDSCGIRTRVSFSQWIIVFLSTSIRFHSVSYICYLLFSPISFNVNTFNVNTFFSSIPLTYDMYFTRF